MDNVKPTRSELMEIKKRITLARSGYNLLKKKRDGLILEFFEVLKRLKNIRAEISDEYKSAIDRMDMARLIEPDIKIRSIALAISAAPGVEVGKKNIMGVPVPEIGEINLQRPALERGYGLYSSPAIDDAAAGYERVVEKIIKAASVEITLRRLLKEIEKTKRRVNALEFEVIPKLDAIKSFIQLRLEEAERENTFRMKKIKKKQKKSQ